MKSPNTKTVHCLKANFTFLLVAAVMLPPIAARAEHLNPGGSYMDAKLVDAKPTTAAFNVQNVGKKALPESDQSTQVRVKEWVAEKIQDLRSYFGGDEHPTVVMMKVENKPAAQTAPKQGSVVQGSAPASSPDDALTKFALRPPIEKSLRAPGDIGGDVPVTDRGPIDQPGVVRKNSGVASYELADGVAIPRLNIENETPVHAAQYLLDTRAQKILNDRVVRALESPTLLTLQEMHRLTGRRVAAVGALQTIKKIEVDFKGKVSRAEFDKLVIKMKPEAILALKKYVPLSQEETLFLSGLMLYQQGEQCPSALGLFHKLSKSPGWEAEADFYLAMCSKQLNLLTDFYERSRRVLLTQDVYYSKKILAEIGFEVPYELADGFGDALLKVSTNAKIMDGLKPDVLANVAFLLADFGISSERFKTALTWAQKVPSTHAKYLKAQFLLALAEYQAGSKENAIKIQDRIVNDKTIEKSNLEFQALVALNAGRMHFQEQNFKQAHEDFQRVYKDHPLWLQSLTEMGWSQLMDGDFEGAIGNMYSIQSPFFSAVYKPESYVIRTIGYLNLCQYGDAYKTLSILEHDYRPFLNKMETYITKPSRSPADYYQTVRLFLTSPPKQGADIDGLPPQVVREMARHRDFTNLQKALNRLVDERPNYNRVNGEVEKSLKRAQVSVTSVRAHTESIRVSIKEAAKRHDFAQRDVLKSELVKGLDKLNDAFFKVDLYTMAKEGMDEYRKEVVVGADKRIVLMRGHVEHVLTNRLLQMKVDLARVLDNNELLRYEVFAGSGENLRFQVAGGEVANRIPASILPKSKSLQWDFDGEYWEDEIGHYRSGLKNNCPQRDDQQRAQASLDGGAK